MSTNITVSDEQYRNGKMIIGRHHIIINLISSLDILISYWLAALERELRRKNLVLKNLEDKDNKDNNETKGKALKLINAMGIKMNSEQVIDEIRRMEKPKPGTTRPILLELTIGSKKFEILKQSNKLKRTNIWIDEDCPKDVIEERKALIPQLKKARQRECKASIKYNKLIINNEVYQEEDIETK
ncbi:hypothetical protein ILUMI_19538 [Ignelater luminosus]|uniref:Uncharacterized protein n=1 Tax=Ignelater luminosus TaxID=2038154 RepID=A0A8K0FZT7_IGNLU|nr:hypothetical protein ILUMI_19538 [Ignelater luminosus]